MNLPFTKEQFYAVFDAYNSTVMPVQILFLLAGIACFALVRSGVAWKDKYIGSCLGFLWIWAGAVYHLAFFTGINKAAWVFGGLFILQGLLIVYHTLSSKRLQFRSGNRVRDLAGFLFAIYGLGLYPLFGFLFEGTSGRIISAGLPCPTTILTFGFFLVAANGFPWHLLIIPAIWSVIGLNAAFSFGVYQDLMLPVAAFFTVILLLTRTGERRFDITGI